MQLRQLMGAVQVLRSEGTPDRDITGLAYDSRRVMPGMLFVALRGGNTDGHDHIVEAIDRGAAAIVCEQNGFASHRAAKIRVADTREALALLAAEFYGHPSSRLKVVGVTGTNGKTTVAFLVKHLLESAGLPTGLISTVRYEVAGRIFPASRTTPESLDTQHLMAQMVREGCRACVMEVSSHALMQHRVTGVEFDLGVFTNLTQDHLDYHGTLTEYFAAKQRLFAQMDRGRKRAHAVINLDDSFGRDLFAKVPHARTSFGLEQPAELSATEIQLTRSGTRFTLAGEGGAGEVWLPLIGRHNVSNALAALGVARQLGVPREMAVAALARLRPVPGRLEPVSVGQPFTVLVDYAHTDDALRNVLETVREITMGRVLLTFGCGGNRDIGKRVKMGGVAARLADVTIITSDNPRRESAAAIAAQIQAGFRSVRADGCQTMLDRRRAIEEIVAQARPGDTVLIAGKGHESFQEFHDTVVPFDDRVHAQAALEALHGGAAREERILHAA